MELLEEQLLILHNQKVLKSIKEKFLLEELSNFVGCFLTGTAAEVTPVSCISRK